MAWWILPAIGAGMGAYDYAQESKQYPGQRRFNATLWATGRGTPDLIQKPDILKKVVGGGLMGLRAGNDLGLTASLFAPDEIPAGQDLTNPEYAPTEGQPGYGVLKSSENVTPIGEVDPTTKYTQAPWRQGSSLWDTPVNVPGPYDPRKSAGAAGGYDTPQNTMDQAEAVNKLIKAGVVDPRKLNQFNRSLYAE